MNRRLCLPLLLLMALGTTPAIAKVLEEGKPAKGVYEPAEKPLTALR
jgi:hypothetical protein